MPSSTVKLAESAGAALTAYLAVPDRPNGGSVVVLQEIFGINANIRSVADELAAAGFNAIAPDLFWRQQPGLELDPSTDREKAQELLRGLDVGLAVEDTLAAVDHIRSLDGANGMVGAVGYCLGGKLAYLMSMRPGIDAAISYYGVAIQDQLDRIENVDAPLLLHIAEDDHLCPPEAQNAIEQAAAPFRDLVTVMRYPRVGHAFARRGSPAFDEASANRADRATLDLLNATLIEAA